MSEFSIKKMERSFMFFAFFRRDPVASLLENPVVLKIASAHSKSTAQVLLRHLIQLDVVVIPKSVTPKRVVENFQVFSTHLLISKAIMWNKSNLPGFRLFLVK